VNLIQVKSLNPNHHVVENVLVTIAGRSPTELTAGRFLYCGSANGPGGLSARLARHMRHGKSVHWHIDQLTERGIITGSWIVPNGRQCELVARPDLEWRSRDLLFERAG
jgi:Uri superfamily endonuclease